MEAVGPERADRAAPGSAWPAPPPRRGRSCCSAGAHARVLTSPAPRTAGGRARRANVLHSGGESSSGRADAPSESAERRRTSSRDSVTPPCAAPVSVLVSILRRCPKARRTRCAIAGILRPRRRVRGAVAGAPPRRPHRLASHERDEARLHARPRAERRGGTGRTYSSSARQLHEHRDGGVRFGRRRREQPVGELALHHDGPPPHGRQLGDGRHDQRDGDVVGEVGDQRRRRRLERGEVGLERVARVHDEARLGGGELLEPRQPAAVDLERVHQARPLEHRAREQPAGGPHLEHDVVGAATAPGRRWRAGRCCPPGGSGRSAAARAAAGGDCGRPRPGRSPEAPTSVRPSLSPVGPRAAQ